MSLPIHTCIPPEFSAGSTVIFTQYFSLFAPADWTMKLWFSQGAAAPISVTGTDNGDGSYLFTIANTVTAPMVQGETEFSFVATGGGQTHVAQPTSTVFVLPNFAVAQTPTEAEAMVALFEGVMAEFAGSTKLTVNFAGQSFTRASIKEYNDLLVYWQSRVIQEREIINRRRGGRDQGRIQVRFVPPFNTFPYGVIAGCGPFGTQQ